MNNLFSSNQDALEFVHEYAKQACLVLHQVEDVCIVNEMELTVKAVEGHTFTIPLQPLLEQGRMNDAELVYYFEKKVNEALGYKYIWPSDVSMIYPVMKNTAFIHGLSDVQSNEIIYQGYEGDLWVCYGVYKEGQLHYLTHEQLKYTLGIEAENLHALALENLEAVQSRNAKAGALFDPVWRMAHEVKYADDAGMLLLTSLWQGVMAESGMENIAVSVPHADCVLFCDARNEAAMKALRQKTEQFYGESDEPLSKFIFWWNPEGLYWQTSRFVDLDERLKNAHLNRHLGVRHF